VKIAAHLAKNPSFWVKRVQFFGEYQTSTAGLASKEETKKDLIR
jgi:hypothetical protein